MYNIYIYIIYTYGIYRKRGQRGNQWESPLSSLLTAHRCTYLLKPKP